MIDQWQRWLVCLLCCSAAPSVWAGGSGLNVVVVVNQASTNSVELGNYYCEMRQVPPQNVLRINWPGGNLDWAYADFTNYLGAPLTSMLANRQLTNQVDFVVLSMDIPYRITIPDTMNSTTSALFYGFKTNGSPPATGLPASCSLPAASSNAYAGSERMFRDISPGSLAATNLLATMITASNVSMAKLVVSQGTLSDGAFPTQTAYLAKSGDTARNIRYLTSDNAVFNARLRGNYSLQRTNAAGIWGFGNILGFQSGSYGYDVGNVWFAPGGMADNMTSYGGAIFQYLYGQLSILSLLAAGASGAYGTVDEPCPYYEKFPTPQVYFYQARGFSLAECYYMGVTNPYQGLLAGEPLAAPFAWPPIGAWLNLPPGAALSGATNLSLSFTAPDVTRPVRQVDLFLDGAWFQTLTNIPPGRSNVLTVTLNGQPTNYLVPLNASLTTIASDLTTRLNATSYSNATKVAAFPHGDRIELQSLNPALNGSQVSLSVSNSVGAGSALTTRLAATGPQFLDTTAFGIRQFQVGNGIINPPPTGAWLLLSITRTNGAIVTVGITNDVAGTTVAQLVSNLVTQVNAESLLMGADGCVAQDFQELTAGAEFNLLPRSPGWAAARMQAQLSRSSATVFTVRPTGAQTLTENITDLRPRAHLYVTAGLTNLPLTFPFNTTTLADGCHELTAVAYEGSHVRTQKRVSQNVLFQNGTVSATFTTLFGGTNTDVSATLQFSVVANTGTVTNIELFSTGGSLTNVTGQSSAVFSVAGTNLGLGLHPFYAVVTIPGKQYRTETRWIRLLGPEPAFRVTAATPATTISWPATAGRPYVILSASDPAGIFQTNASLTPSNSSALWRDPGPVSPRFYRVRTAY